MLGNTKSSWHALFLKLIPVLSLLGGFGVQAADLPSQGTQVVLKGNTLTFNHVNEYAISDQELFVRRRNDPSARWQRIESEPGSAPPIEIKADGANLMVRDTLNRIHYKKVLKEKRRGEVYSYQDISLTSPWMPQWYSLPIISLFHPVGAELHLQIPEGARDWAASHRGIYNRYFNNARNGRQYAFPMVTSAYAIPKDGMGVVFADPFLHGGFAKFIAGPHPDFEGLYLDAAASTILLMGVQKGIAKLYYRLADFDTLGKNPFLPGFWLKKFAGPNQWVEVPLPTDAVLRYETVTIFQTEEQGNGAREIRIGGERKGVPGFFRKKILSADWTFVPILSNSYGGNPMDILITAYSG